jgi:hypothetical protein
MALLEDFRAGVSALGMQAGPPRSLASSLRGLVLLRRRRELIDLVPADPVVELHRIEPNLILYEVMGYRSILCPQLPS